MMAVMGVLQIVPATSSRPPPPKKSPRDDKKPADPGCGVGIGCAMRDEADDSGRTPALPVRGHAAEPLWKDRVCAAWRNDGSGAPRAAPAFR